MFFFFERERNVVLAFCVPLTGLRSIPFNYTRKKKMCRAKSFVISTFFFLSLLIFGICRFVCCCRVFGHLLGWRSPFLFEIPQALRDTKKRRWKRETKTNHTIPWTDWFFSLFLVWLSSSHIHSVIHSFSVCVCVEFFIIIFIYDENDVAILYIIAEDWHKSIFSIQNKNRQKKTT